MFETRTFSQVLGIGGGIGGSPTEGRRTVEQA